VKRLLWVLALVLCVGATISTGESQAQPRLGKRPAPLGICQGLGCTNELQCAAACGGPGNAACVDHRCVLL
jgi:hypothetical protein